MREPFEQECTDCPFNQDCKYWDESIGMMVNGTECGLTGSLTPFFGREKDCPYNEEDDA